MKRALQIPSALLYYPVSFISRRCGSTVKFNTVSHSSLYAISNLLQSLLLALGDYANKGTKFSHECQHKCLQEFCSVVQSKYLFPCQDRHSLHSRHSGNLLAYEAYPIRPKNCPFHGSNIPHNPNEVIVPRADCNIGSVHEIRVRRLQEGPQLLLLCLESAVIQRILCVIKPAHTQQRPCHFLPPSVKSSHMAVCTTALFGGSPKRIP